MIRGNLGFKRVDQDVTRVTFREPRRSQIVYAPSYPLLAAELHKRLAQRHLAASEDGSHVAAVTRRTGSSCSIVVHSSLELALPGSVFGEAMIVHVYSDCAVKAWGEYEGRRGIWMLTKNAAPRLVAHLDRVEAIVPSSNGTVVIGTFGNGQRRYVARNAEVVVPEGTRIVIDSKGVSHGLIPLGSGTRRSWILPPATDPRQPDDECGPPIYPLPFGAEHVEPFLYHDRLMCVLRDGDASAYWSEQGFSGSHASRGVGLLTPMSSREHPETGVDFVWTSPDTSSTVALIRPKNERRADGTQRNGVYRTLLRNSVDTVFQGSFHMRKNDLRWSPDGSRFVAHIRLVDSDGNHREERIVTSDGRRFAVPGMAYEPTIDDAGRVAYVLDDKTGRHVVVDSVMTSGYPYAWNVAHGEDCVTANILVCGKIHRIELPYGR